MSKYCSSCGKKLGDDSKFCDKCGEPTDKQEVQEQPQPVNNQPQQVIYTKQCPYCKQAIDVNASICPYCRQKLKRGTGCGIIISWGFILIVGAAIFLAVTGRAGVLSKNDLVIENASGSHNALGVSTWEGDLVNKGNVSIENIVIQYTCYNDSKEYVGTVQSKIKRIEGKETIHFHATGLVKPDGQVTCESSIKIVSTDEFNNDK